MKILKLWNFFETLTIFENVMEIFQNCKFLKLFECLKINPYFWGKRLSKIKKEPNVKKRRRLRPSLRPYCYAYSKKRIIPYNFRFEEYDWKKSEVGTSIKIRPVLRANRYLASSWILSQSSLNHFKINSNNKLTCLLSQEGHYLD